MGAADVIENQKDVDDAEDIVRSIKTDLSSDDVFVFTPKGDVITLPVGATVIDFAYAIHSAVGNRMVGAKVDGRIVPLDYQVKTGEIVEVLTTSAPGRGPSRDWLNIVKTGEARNKIRAWFKNERREENIQQGKADLERELTRNYIRLPEDKMEEFLLAQSKKQHCATLDDFYAAIGYGGVLLSLDYSPDERGLPEAGQGGGTRSPGTADYRPPQAPQQRGRHYRWDGQLPGEVRPVLQPGAGGIRSSASSPGATGCPSTSGTASTCPAT